MIQIYIPGNEQWQKNGDAVLWCYACNLSVELNGTWYIDLSAPIDKEGRWKLITEEAVLKVPTFQEDEQLYRIKKVTKTDTVIQAVAYPIFYDSADDAMLMDVRPTNKTGQQALDIMCADTPYSGESNITSVNTAYFVRRNLLNAINGTDAPTFVSRWGGEILYDNYKVIINNRVGGDYGMEARYGRNINGVSYTVDTSTLVTRIIPVAYNGRMMSGDEPWVDSDNINRYAKIYTQEIRYEHIRLAADVSNSDTEGIIICGNQVELNAALLAAAQADFDAGLDTPNVSMELDMAMILDMASEYTDPLLDSDGVQIQDSFGDDIESVWYRNYATLEDVRIGDTVHCRDSRIDVTSTARVIALTWDCIGKRVTHVSLGDYQYNYVKEMSILVNRVKNVLSAEGTVIAEQVKGFLDGSQTQLRTQYNLATHQDTLAILFENLDENSPMYGALGIGTQGISISKTRTADGRDWEWTTGITANGMNASMGVFGILADKLGINYINLDTGQFSFGGSTTTIGGKTIAEYMGDAHDELVAYEQSNDAVIRQIQSQLVGAIESYFKNYDPTLDNLPAVEWTTEQLKKEHEGDLFYNKTNGKSWRFFQNENTLEWSWDLITDQAVTEALAIASAAKDTADEKRRVFVVQPTGPYDEGDLWYTGKEVKVCNHPNSTEGGFVSTDWVRKDEYFATDDFDTFLAQYDEEIGGLGRQIDRKIETFSQDTDPSTSWSAEQKAAHDGDMWYDTSNGKLFRYSYAQLTWTETTATPPNSVVTTINKKAVIWTEEPVPPYKVGDLYFAGADSDILTCIKARSSGSFNQSDWQKRNKYTDDSAINTFIQTTFADYMAQVQEQIDQKIETWYQPTDPSTAWTRQETDVILQDHTGADILDSAGNRILTTRDVEKYEHIGDIWKRTSDNTEWVYNGGGWDPMDAPDELYDLIDGKSAVFTSSSAPANPQNRDLWFRGPMYPIYTYINGQWIEYNKYTSDENLDDFVDNTFTPWKQTTDNNVSTVMEKLDGQIIMAVCNGNIINAINMSTEGIAIQATKLNINGATSINNYFKVNTDGTFNAKKGDIGNIHVVTDAIYSGNKTTYNSTYAGFFLGSDGKFGLGNSNAYIQWTGSALNMAVSSLTIGGTTAATTTDTTNAGRKATDYLYYHSDVGLVVSPNGTNYTSGYNTRVKSSGIFFYDRTNLLAELTGSALKFYYSGTQRMVLNSSSLIFYKSDGTTTAASITSNGMEVATGKVAGFTIDSNAIYTGTLGSANSAFFSSGTSGSASIAGSGNISGWAFTASNTFGVTKAGALYSTSGLIGGIHIASGSIYSGSHTAYNSSNQGFYLGSDGKFGIGDATNYIRWDGSVLNLQVSSLKIGGTTAATTTDTGNAAKTATNYLYYSESTGLVVSRNGSSYSAGYNTQITADGIYLRSGLRNLASLTGTQLTFYRSNNNAAMTLTSSALTFYKTDGTTVAATINTNGLDVAAGKIGGFTTDATSITYGTQAQDNSFWLQPAGSASGVVIARQTDKIWAMTLGAKFGVTRKGNLYCNGGQIAGWTLSDYGLTAVDDNAFMQIGFAKLQSNGDAFTVKYGLHVYTRRETLDSGQREFKLFGMQSSSGGSYLRFVSGSSGTVGYNSSSSIRYKIVDRDMTSADIEQAYNIQPVMAKYKAGYLHQNDERYDKVYPMFIAENVAEYLPDAVDHNDDGQIENWNDRVMIPIMFQMLKDQKKEIEELKALINQKGIA